MSDDDPEVRTALAATFGTLSDAGAPDRDEWVEPTCPDQPVRSTATDRAQQA